LLIGSITEFLTRASSRYSAHRATDALLHPLFYWVLGVLALVGIVMLLIGREVVEIGPQALDD